jgi:hypothetical protein
MCAITDSRDPRRACLFADQPTNQSTNQSTSLAMICATTDQETAFGIELATQETSTCR